MPDYRFLQLDVFTDRAFCGNPLAVFLEAEGIPDEQMGKIAREMNLSETVFVLKSESDKALRRLRIFTPAREIPFRRPSDCRHVGRAREQRCGPATRRWQWLATDLSRSRDWSPAGRY